MKPQCTRLNCRWTHWRDVCVKHLMPMSHLVHTAVPSESVMPMRVAILHNAVPDDAPLEDQDTLVQVDAVRAALARLGHEPATVSCTLDLAALRDELRRLRPDVVFNLVESLAEADSLVYLPVGRAGRAGPAVHGQPDGIALSDDPQAAGQRAAPAGRTAHAALGWKARRSIHEDIDSRTEQARMHCPICVASFVFFVDHQRRLGPGLARHGRRCGAEGRRSGRGAEAAGRAGRAVRPALASPSSSSKAGSSISRCWPARRARRSSRRPRSTSPLSRPAKPRIVGHRAKWQADSFEYHHTPRRFDFPPVRPAAVGRSSVTWPRSVGRCLGCGAGSGSIFGWMPPGGRGFWRSTPTRVSRPTPVLPRRLGRRRYPSTRDPTNSGRLLDVPSPSGRG